MSEDKPTEQAPPPERRAGGWRRSLSYLLLLAGVVLTFLNSEVARGLGVPSIVVQISALGLLLAGAALFYSVRQRPDRLTDYRQAFRPVELPVESAPPAPNPEPEPEPDLEQGKNRRSSSNFDG